MEKETFEKYLVNELSDELNPKYMFQTTYTALLVDIATGKVDAKAYARMELANRGLGKNGKWVGFEQAYKDWGLKYKYGS